LLVPAAVTVMLSHLVQKLLSSRLKYTSLYEAQVPNRADSPAHHTEHLCMALDFMCKPRLSDPSMLCHLDLVNLLQSGVPVDLGREKQLMIGVLQLESPWVGKPISSGCQKDLENEMEIIAILRDGQILMPYPDMLLKAEDRILAITSPHLKKRLERHLGPHRPDGRPGRANRVGKDYQRGLFPTITAGAAINWSHTFNTIGTNARAGSTIPDYQLPIDLSWVLDIWGNIRRTVEAAQANAQASASDLEVTTSQYKVGIACALDVITR
jgi:hypothetical protein